MQRELGTPEGRFPALRRSKVRQSILVFGAKRVETLSSFFSSGFTPEIFFAIQREMELQVQAYKHPDKDKKFPHQDSFPHQASGPFLYVFNDDMPHQRFHLELSEATNAYKFGDPLNIDEIILDDLDLETEDETFYFAGTFRAEGANHPSIVYAVIRTTGLQGQKFTFYVLDLDQAPRKIVWTMVPQRLRLPFTATMTEFWVINSTLMLTCYNIIYLRFVHNWQSSRPTAGPLIKGNRGMIVNALAPVEGVLIEFGRRCLLIDKETKSRTLPPTITPFLRNAGFDRSADSCAAWLENANAGVLVKAWLDKETMLYMDLSERHWLPCILNGKCLDIRSLPSQDNVLVVLTHRNIEIYASDLIKRMTVPLDLTDLRQAASISFRDRRQDSSRTTKQEMTISDMVRALQHVRHSDYTIKALWQVFQVGEDMKQLQYLVDVNVGRQTLGTLLGDFTVVLTLPPMKVLLIRATFTSSSLCLIPALTGDSSKEVVIARGEADGRSWLNLAVTYSTSLGLKDGVWFIPSNFILPNGVQVNMRDPCVFPA